jgi:UDP-2,3-diacylglucosamine hydrolase
MKMIVVSDIHIESPADPAYRALIDLMQKRLESDSTFVLAGDIFDFMMGGPQSFAVDYAEFFRTLKELHQKNITVHYIEGNHDFHLKSFVAQLPNVHLHSSEVNIQIGDKKVHVAHGDLVDGQDHGYRFLRFILRSSVVAIAGQIVPEEVVLKIGEKLGVATKGLRKNSDPKVERGRILFRNYAVKKFEEGFDAVILGHSHDFDQDDFRIQERVCQYLNVGFPKAHKQVIQWNPLTNRFERSPFYSS